MRQSETGFHIEYFIRDVYQARPVELELPLLCDLLSWLLHKAQPQALRIDHPAKRQQRLEAITYLFKTVGTQQPEFFLRFIQMQRIEDRPSLMPFVAFSEVQREGQSDDESDWSSEDPVTVVLLELKSGNAAKLFKLACCIERITVEKGAHQKSLFLKLLKLLCDLDEAKIARHQNDVCRICASHFSSSELMAIVDSPEITPEQILGLSRFVHYCNRRVLTGAAQYYSRLYELFQRAAGDQRQQLVRICYAIEMVTHRSVLSVQGIAEQHRALIQKMISRIRGSPVKPRAGGGARRTIP
jgi:hypothetical protein